MKWTYAYKTDIVPAEFTHEWMVLSKSGSVNEIISHGYCEDPAKNGSNSNPLVYEKAKRTSKFAGELFMRTRKITDWDDFKK